MEKNMTLEELLKEKKETEQKIKEVCADSTKNHRGYLSEIEAKIEKERQRQVEEDREVWGEVHNLIGECAQLASIIGAVRLNSWFRIASHIGVVEFCDTEEGLSYDNWYRYLDENKRPKASELKKLRDILIEKVGEL